VRFGNNVHPGAPQELDEVEPDNRLVFGYENPDAASVFSGAR
jgi:hypothetical protein